MNQAAQLIEIGKTTSYQPFHFCVVSATPAGDVIHSTRSWKWVHNWLWTPVWDGTCIINYFRFSKENLITILIESFAHNGSDVGPDGQALLLGASGEEGVPLCW